MRFGRFYKGVAKAMSAIRSGGGDAKARKEYGVLIIGIMVGAVILGAAGVGTVVGLTSEDVLGGWYSATARPLLRVGAIACAVVLSPVLVFMLLNVLMPMVGDRVLVSALRAHRPEDAGTILGDQRPSFGSTVAGGMTRAGRLLLLSAVAWLMLFLPFIGPFVAPVAQVWIGARLLGWELIAPYLGRRHPKVRDQLDYLHRHGAALTGYGLPYSLALAVPLAGPLLLGNAQAGAARLILDVLRKDEEEPKDRAGAGAGAEAGAGAGAEAGAGAGAEAGTEAGAEAGDGDKS